MRLKLYMMLCLLAVREPHDVFGAPYLWAEALDLPDFQGQGARRVREAIRWLEKANLIKVERRQGKYPTIFLLSQRGTGKPYKRPAVSGEPYASMPVAFWRNAWILVMSPGAIAVLLILLQLQYGRTPEDPPWIRSPWRYDLSADTWTRGTTELVRLGLLKKERVVRGDELEWRRRRNVYWIDLERLEDVPTEPFEP